MAHRVQKGEMGRGTQGVNVTITGLYSSFFLSINRNKNEKVKPLSLLFPLPVFLFDGNNRSTNIDANGGFFA